jgi:hypothetical protein
MEIGGPQFEANLERKKKNIYIGVYIYIYIYTHTYMCVYIKIHIYQDHISRNKTGKVGYVYNSCYSVGRGQKIAV